MPAAPVAKPIHLCVPTLKRYDLLHRLLISAAHSVPLPAAVHVIDNGGQLEREGFPFHPATAPFDIYVHEPIKMGGCPLGLAESWNWFLRHVPEERVIVNDDIVLAPGSLAEIVRPPGHFISALAGSNAFSCFVIRDVLVELIGDFDETISPGYAYFEDNDYAERMAEVNIPIQSVCAGVEHAHSQTLLAYTPEELQAHHQKFEIAKMNFVKKWGRMPR